MAIFGMAKKDTCKQPPFVEKGVMDQPQLVGIKAQLSTDHNRLMLPIYPEF